MNNTEAIRNAYPAQIPTALVNPLDEKAHLELLVAVEVQRQLQPFQALLTKLVEDMDEVQRYLNNADAWGANINKQLAALSQVCNR